MNSLLAICRKYPLRMMWAVVMACMAIHATTMAFSPVHWIDDVMITEFSRIWWSTPDNDWTLVWNPVTAGRGYPGSVAYLGGLMLECGYRLFGHLGPRVLMMGWLLLLSAIVSIYICRKTSDRMLAALSGVLCFAAPCLTQSARGARVDVMAVSFALLSALLSTFGAGSVWLCVVLFALSGVCMALSAFTWLPGLMLAPLVAWEILDCLLQRKAAVREMILLIGAAGFGFLFAVVALMFPFYPDLVTPFACANKDVAIVSAQGVAGWHWLAFVKATLEIPELFILGFVALFICRRTWLLACLWSGVALVCISTKVYVFRMVYLWPYALVGLIAFCSTLRGRMREGALVALSLMCLASIGWSVFIRNGTEFFVCKFRDYDKLRNDMEREIGYDARVYMMCDHQYYIGRELGWKQYRGQFKDAEKNLLDKVDYVLAEEKWMNAEVVSQIAAHGFLTNRIICADVKKPSNAFERFLVSRGRDHSYGPYRLFWRGRVCGEKER